MIDLARGVASKMAKLGFAAWIALLLVACGGDSATDADDARSAAEETSTQSTISTTVAPTTAAPTTVAATAPPTTPTTAAPAPPPPPPEAIMPNVMCMNLQEAQDAIQSAGVFFSRSDDASGQGRSQVLDSNWYVVGQRPPPGTPVGELEAVLSVLKYGEPGPC